MPPSEEEQFPSDPGGDWKSEMNCLPPVGNGGRNVSPAVAAERREYCSTARSTSRYARTPTGLEAADLRDWFTRLKEFAKIENRGFSFKRGQSIRAA